MIPLHASSHDGSSPGVVAPGQLPYGTWHWDATSDMMSFAIAGQRDEAATRVLAGPGDANEAAELRTALEVLGFGFAGARGPANGDLTP